MIELDKLFPANQVTPADPNTYPYGGFKDETDPNKTGDGTPITADWLNDWLGFDGALMKDAGMTANQKPDTASASQRLDALKKIISENISSVQTLQPKTQADVNLITILPSTTYLVIDWSKITENITIMGFKGTKAGQKFNMNLINGVAGLPHIGSVRVGIWNGTLPIRGDYVPNGTPYLDLGILSYSNVVFSFIDADHVYVDSQMALRDRVFANTATAANNAAAIAVNTANRITSNGIKSIYSMGVNDNGSGFNLPPGWASSNISTGVYNITYPYINGATFQVSSFTIAGPQLVQWISNTQTAVRTYQSGRPKNTGFYLTAFVL